VSKTTTRSGTKKIRKVVKLFGRFIELTETIQGQFAHALAGQPGQYRPRNVESQLYDAPGKKAVTQRVSGLLDEVDKASEE
jgi:hypothetical protein